jgi:cytoskeletal protein RodZ
MPDGAGLGALLRECREAKGTSLDDLSRATRIAPRVLLALEEDRLRDLPVPVFVRGFIRSYCAAVAEPPERALALYEAWVQANGRPEAKLPATVLEAAPAERSRLTWRSLAPRLVVGGILIVIGGAVYLLVSSAGTRPAEPPHPADGAEAPATPADRPATPAADKPVAPPDVRQDADAHSLMARAHEPTWVWVRPEDSSAHREVLEPGAVRGWRSPGRFTVTVGNAGGLGLELDGVTLSPLGDRGQVVRDLTLPREPVP